MIGLTDKQKQVLLLLAKGLSTKEISRETGLSTHGVEFHNIALRRKSGSTSRLEMLYHYFFGDDFELLLKETGRLSVDADAKSIVMLMMQGASDKEIAERTGFSVPFTIFLKKWAFNYFGMRRRTELLYKAFPAVYEVGLAKYQIVESLGDAAPEQDSLGNDS